VGIRAAGQALPPQLEEERALVKVLSAPSFRFRGGHYDFTEPHRLHFSIRPSQEGPCPRVRILPGPSRNTGCRVRPSVKDAHSSSLHVLPSGWHLPKTLR
jgi:hypothetical protein